MKTILRVFSFLLLISFTHLASAQVTFTVTATANATAENYTSGNAYTFIFTMGDFTNLSATGSTSYSQPTLTFYQEENTGADQLWSSVGGTGLAGSYVRPTGNYNDPASSIQTSIPSYSDYNALSISVGTDQDVTQTIGLTTLSGTSLSYIYIHLDDAILPTWAMNGGNPTTTTPEAYFSAYVGTYTGVTATDTDNMLEFYNASGTKFLYFTVTSVAISAVPEPSTYAAMFGVSALALAAWRRRRIKA